MTRMLTAGTLLLSSTLLAVTTSPAAAQAAGARPSFSCAKAAKAPERMICKDPELARLDRIMADLFAQTRSLLLNDTQRAEADGGQRVWVRQRNKCGDVQCLRRAYFTRVTDLARELPSEG